MQSTRARRRSNACLEHLQRPSCSPASFACCTRSLFKPCRSVGIVSLAERKTSKRRLGKELPESADTAMAGEHESQTTSTSTSHRHFRIAHKEIRNRSRSSDNNLADPGVACTRVIDRRVDRSTRRSTCTRVIARRALTAMLLWELGLTIARALCAVLMVLGWGGGACNVIGTQEQS